MSHGARSPDDLPGPIPLTRTLYADYKKRTDGNKVGEYIARIRAGSKRSHLHNGENEAGLRILLSCFWIASSSR